MVNVHNYAEVEGWPTWRRSYPEDPAIEWQRDLGHVLKWRAQNAPDKEVWLTEFGWDASTKPAPATGTFAKWVGSSETEQAQWIVRGYLLLAALGLDRAYLFYFNDDDTAHVHGSSGLTRNFAPKPAFHAAAHLQKTLGDYRFSRALQDDPAGFYAYEFQHGTDTKRRIFAVWKPHGPAGKITLPIGAAKVAKAERMPMSAEAPETLEITRTADGTIEVEAGAAPLYVWLDE